MERDLQSVLDAVLEGILVLDEKGVLERLNSEACRILETSTEFAQGSKLEALLGADHPVAALTRNVVNTQRPAVQDEVRLERRLGDDLPIEVAVSPLDGPDRKLRGIVVMLRDRTVANTLRELVDQREQLASYGHIAAGIAHEVKNPLGGIRGAAELLGSWSDNDRARSTASLIVREVDRITSLVDELMIFARGDVLKIEPFNLHFIIDQVLELADLDPLSDQIEIERFYDPSIPEFLGDSSRLTQAFLNLVRNSLQAMEGCGGTLTLTTGMSLDQRLSNESGQRLPTVVVAVSDTGPGIPRNILDQLGTPFFTTRDKGTGLGLSVARHWITRHGGSLRITSQPGEGTTARVALPLRRET